MKITQRGFIVPLLLIIVAILLGGGAYVYMQNKQVKQSAVATCIDSDGGKNIYVKGAATTVNKGQETIYVGEDSCATPYVGPAKPYADPAKYTTGLPSCSGSNCYIEEYYCGDYQGSLISQHEFVQCLHGCTDGACLK